MQGDAKNWCKYPQNFSIQLAQQSIHKPDKIDNNAKIGIRGFIT